MSGRDNALRHKSHPGSMGRRPPIRTSHYRALSRIMNLLSGTTEKNPAFLSGTITWAPEKHSLCMIFTNETIPAIEHFYSILMFSLKITIDRGIFFLFFFLFRKTLTFQVLMADGFLARFSVFL